MRICIASLMRMPVLKISTASNPKKAAA